MNRPTDEQQDRMEENNTKSLSQRKKRGVQAVIIAAAALIATPVLAWLFMQRSMETMTQINMPYALRIGAGNVKPVQQLELSNIDVSGEQKSKDVVFCVYSEESKVYHLELAHTTNIGFQYTIYKASISDAGKINYLGRQYQQDELLAGKYLNQDKVSKYATKAYHQMTYGSYAGVQASAEPLYWITDSQESLPTATDATGYYVNYYILHISWDETVQNNKETDMVYLMAG